MGHPLRPSPRERRFDGMHNEHLGDTPRGRFDEIILPHLDAAHNLARWLVRGSDDAEDVVQEACLRAFRYFGSFRGGNARAWLLSIVRTTAFRWLKKNRAQTLATEFDEELHSEACEALNPETVLLQRADSRWLEQAINHLPVRLREVWCCVNWKACLTKRSRRWLAFPWARSCRCSFARVNDFDTPSWLRKALRALALFDGLGRIARLLVRVREKGMRLARCRIDVRRRTQVRKGGCGLTL